ncbi:MAG: zinc-ribbon domain-containing protein [bacterium]
MEDKTIVCKECKKEFTFTAGEQEFYKERGFTNEPVRCKECRDKKKADQNNNRPNFRKNFDQ